MSKKTIALVAVLIFLLAGAAVFGFLMWKNKGDAGTPVSFMVNAQGWSEETSSPIPVHVTGETVDKEKVDEKYFIGRSEEDLVLQEGTYTVEVYASPVNVDGGMYKAPEPVELVISEKTDKAQQQPGAPTTSASPSVSADSSVQAVASAEINLSPVSPREVSDDEIQAAYDAMRDAGLSDEEIKQFEKAVEDAKLPAAAKLSDEELLALLASAPLAPPDADNPRGVTHYSNNQARVDDISAYTNDGSSVDTGCGLYDDERNLLKPLIVDVNNDGIRDIVSVARLNPCGVGGVGYQNFLRRIVVYTPTEDGKELRVLAYTANDSFTEVSNDLVSNQFEYSRWWFKEENISDGNIQESTITTATDPILGFEDGRISVKAIRTVLNDLSRPDAQNVENYTVFFEIQGDELVPVEARKG